MTDMKIVIVNTGVGNVRSVANMLQRLRVTAEISNSADIIRGADALILPGVGSYDAAIRRFRAAGIMDVLDEKVAREGIPALGLCLGMQLLAEGSEEGREPGFGWIPGRLARLPVTGAGGELVRVPHMGWNIIRATEGCVLYDGLGEEPRFYFDHSYYFGIDNMDYVCGQVGHGIPFAAGVRRGNLFGVQFHPEKSHRFGLGLFKNFLAYAGTCGRKPLLQS